MRSITRQVRVLVLAVVSAAVLAMLRSSREITGHEWPQMLLFVGMTAIAYSLRIPDPRGWSATPSTVLSYLAIYIFDPPTALLLFGIGRTIGYVVSRGWIPWRALFNGCQIALSVALGAWVFRLLGGMVEQTGLPSAYPAFIAGPLASHIANNFFVAIGVSRWRRTPFLNTWFAGIRYLFWPNALSIPTALLLSIFYANVHYVTVTVYLVLLPLQWQALRLYMKRRQLSAQIIDGLVVATDVNFPLGRGRGHARRVADLAVAISREMRLGESMVELVQFAALLHDVGMIGKDDLLERPIPTAEDEENLLDHVRVGAKIARELPRKEIADAILRHHERYDGTGYPDGMSGEAIPLPARIIALAEDIDSMAFGIYPNTSASSSAAIISYVLMERGKAFDPEVVDAFLRAVEMGEVALDLGTQPGEVRPASPELGGLPV